MPVDDGACLRGELSPSSDRRSLVPNRAPREAPDDRCDGEADSRRERPTEARDDRPTPIRPAFVGASETGGDPTGDLSERGAGRLGSRRSRSVRADQGIFTPLSLLRVGSSIDGRVAVVTGGGSSIGRTTALEFAERGADVVVGVAAAVVWLWRTRLPSSSTKRSVSTGAISASSTPLLGFDRSNPHPPLVSTLSAGLRKHSDRGRLVDPRPSMDDEP